MHPDIENATAFAAEPVFLTDEDGCNVVTVVCKATFDILDSGIALSPKQQPVQFEADHFGPEPASSSIKYESETAFTKTSTDVVLIGTAYPSSARAKTVDAGLKVGQLSKIARVFGDRQWVSRGGQVVCTPPDELHAVPLRFEHAFGGKEPGGGGGDGENFEVFNPVGSGFSTRPWNDHTEFRLPNIETADNLIQKFGQRVVPTGFGFVSPHWEDRRPLAGTYDSAWQKSRMPLLPLDFDRRFFNAGSRGLISPSFLTGVEQVVVVNAGKKMRIVFNLPGIPNPEFVVNISGKPDIHLTSNLDTVIINTDEMKLFLIWRQFTHITDAHAVDGLVINCRHPAAYRKAEL